MTLAQEIENDMKKAKEAGYNYRAFFIDSMGHSFIKDFKGGKEMDNFIEQVKKAGTKLLGEPITLNI